MGTTQSKGHCIYACTIGRDLSLCIDVHHTATGAWWDVYTTDSDGNFIFRVAATELGVPALIPAWTQIALERMQAWESGTDDPDLQWTGWPTMKEAMHETDVVCFDDETMVRWIGKTLA